MLRRSIAAALLGATLTAAPAEAGTYTLSIDPADELSGWTSEAAPGLAACSPSQRPGPCNDADVPARGPLRLFLHGPTGGDHHATWRWTAPPTVSIASGVVHVRYATGAAPVSVYLKAKLRSEDWGAGPRLRVATDSGTGAWTIPAGNEELSVNLIAAERIARPVEKWNNTLAIDELALTLRDDTAPSLSVGGDLAADRWHSAGAPVCADVAAADAGAGLAQIALLDPSGRVLDSQAPARRGARQPGQASWSGGLCADPADVADGAHALTVRATDAAGEVRSVPVTFRLDTGAPEARQLSPAGATTDRRPAVRFSVDGGASGLASFTATLDGAPMAVDAGVASLTPAADLGFGEHTVVWRAADGAGNTRDGFWTFRVADGGPPQLTAATPADGATGEERRPAIGFRLTDVGTGVDPLTLRVLLDGVDVAAAGAFADGEFRYVPPGELAFGAHAVRVLAADRSGNAMIPVEWAFTVADRTAPALLDPRPDPGAAGSDRTPAIGVTVADGGVGVDPASLSVVLDGRDVTALGSVAGDRFTYLPPAALAFGEHTVVVRAADRAGNAAPPLAWTFTVRDEVAPRIGDRAPAAGSTLAGDAVVAFALADEGVGVDPSTLQVLLDGSDVTGWGTASATGFRYAAAGIAPGVHTVAVTVADRAGNLAGPIVWQFAVADPDRLSLTRVGGPGVITAGGSATLRFAAANRGRPLPRAEVRVAARPAGQAAFGPERVLTADAAGVVAWRVAPARTTTYRVRLAGVGDVAVTHTVAVRRRVTLAAGDHSIRRGQAVRLSGAVRPGAAGGAVRLQMLTARGWVTVATPRLGRRSTFAHLVVPRVAGRYLFRAVAPATAANGEGRSATVTVHVR